MRELFSELETMRMLALRQMFGLPVDSREISGCTK